MLEGGGNGGIAHPALLKDHVASPAGELSFSKQCMLIILPTPDHGKHVTGVPLVSEDTLALLHEGHCPCACRSCGLGGIIGVAFVHVNVKL